MRSPPRVAREILKVATAIARSAVLPRRVGHGLAAIVTLSSEAGFLNSLLTQGPEATVPGLL